MANFEKFKEQIQRQICKMIEGEQKLLAILEEKQDENLRGLSTEEITKMIEEI